MISCTCICMYLQHYMTKQSTHQSIKQLLVSKLMSSHSDTAATAVQRRHLALAFKVLPLMVKEKVSGRVLTTDAELNKNEKKNIWQLMVFRWKLCRDHQVQWSNIDFLRVLMESGSFGGIQTSSLGRRTSSRRRWSQLGSSPQQCGSSWLKTWNTTFRYVHLDTFRYILVHARFLSPQ